MQVTEILRALTLSEMFLIKTRVLTHTSNHQHKHVQIHFYVYTHFFIRITISEGLRFHARLITNRRKKKEKDLPKLALVSRIGGKDFFQM